MRIQLICIVLIVASAFAKPTFDKRRLSNILRKKGDILLDQEGALTIDEKLDKLYDFAFMNHVTTHILAMVLDSKFPDSGVYDDFQNELDQFFDEAQQSSGQETGSADGEAMLTVEGGPPSGQSGDGSGGPSGDGSGGPSGDGSGGPSGDGSGGPSGDGSGGPSGDGSGGPSGDGSGGPSGDGSGGPSGDGSGGPSGDGSGGPSGDGSGGPSGDGNGGPSGDGQEPEAGGSGEQTPGGENPNEPPPASNEAELVEKALQLETRLLERLTAMNLKNKLNALISRKRK